MVRTRYFYRVVELDPRETAKNEEWLLNELAKDNWHLITATRLLTGHMRFYLHRLDVREKD